MPHIDSPADLRALDASELPRLCAELRRFIIEADDQTRVGLVELVEINYIHRRAEFQIIIAPGNQGSGYAKPATLAALDYAFRVLNLHKVYLLVSEKNEIAIRVYEDCGIQNEACLVDEFFVDGGYEDAIRMYRLQSSYIYWFTKTFGN